MVRGWFQSRPKCDSNEAHHQSHHHGWFQGFCGSESPAERMHKVAQSSRANATGATWWLSVGYEKNQHSEHRFRNYYILISSYIRIHVEYIHLHLGHLGTNVIVSGLCIDTTERISDSTSDPWDYVLISCQVFCHECHLQKKQTMSMWIYIYIHIYIHIHIYICMCGIYDGPNVFSGGLWQTIWMGNRSQQTSI